MKILVLGGTRFVGKRLVQRLICEGHDVTIATRGLTKDNFSYHVERIIVDREDAEAMKYTFADESFDLVYDQLCHHPLHAKAAVEAFGKRVKRYVMTSSLAVYKDKYGIIEESDFNARFYRVDLNAEMYSYAEGTRQAEAFLFQRASFPVVTVRFATIIAEDDYTGRFNFVMDHVTNGIPLGVHMESRPTSFITADSAAQFLNYIGVYSKYSSAVNACDEGYYTGQDMAEAIGQCMGLVPKSYYTEAENGDMHFNPYAFKSMLKMSTERALTIGYEFPNFRGQLPDMVEYSLMREPD